MGVGFTLFENISSANLIVDNQPYGSSGNGPMQLVRTRGDSPEFRQRLVPISGSYYHGSVVARVAGMDRGYRP
jgi:hypothetical protein